MPDEGHGVSGGTSSRVAAVSRQALVPHLSLDRLNRVAENLEAVREEAVRARAREELGQGRVGLEYDVVRLRRYASSLYTEQMCAQMADDLVEWSLDQLKAGEGPVILLRWCVAKGIHKRRLRDTAGRSPLFAEAMEFALMVQELSLIEGGLSKKSQADIVKLLLESEHEMRERHDVTAGAGGMPSSVEEADRRIAELQSHKAALARILEQAKELGTGIVDG